MNRRSRTLIALPALVLTFAACGGGGVGGSEGESDEAKPYVDAMVASMTEEEDSPMDEKQARCFSEGFVDVVGLDRIKKAGTAEEWGEESGDLEFTELKLTTDEGNDIYDQFEECGVDMREAMIESLGADESDPVAKECFETAITEENLREFFVTVMVEGEEVINAEPEEGSLMAELMTCMMAGVGGTETPTE